MRKKEVLQLGYSIWLEFDKKSTATLKDDISTLATKYGSPKFHPHMTLIGDIDRPVDQVTYLTERFAECSHPSSLEIQKVGVTNNYFMALFLAVDIPAELAKARESFARSATPSSYTLDDPHISLAYGDINSNASDAVVSQLKSKYIGMSLGVCGLSVVESSKSIPVDDWRTLRQIKLKQRA